jgi:hypothetical protein
MLQPFTTTADPRSNPRSNLLPPGLNCCLNSGLLRAQCVGQVEFSFHDPIRIVFLDGELGREHTR